MSLHLSQSQNQSLGLCAYDLVLYVLPEDQSEKRHGETEAQSFFMCFHTLTLSQQPDRFEKKKEKRQQQITGKLQLLLVGIPLIKCHGSHARVITAQPLMASGLDDSVPPSWMAELPLCEDK